MTTTLAIDQEVRDRAARQAKIDKLSVSAVARILLLDYAEGRIQIGARVQSQKQEEPDFTVKWVPLEVDDETQSKMEDVFVEWDKLDL